MIAIGSIAPVLAEYLRDTVAHVAGAGIDREDLAMAGAVSITIPEAGAEYLRGLPEDADGHLDAAGVLWIGGDGYATSRA